MRILLTERNISPIMSLDNGDIFKYAANYYIVGEINMVDNCRECYNLSENHACNIYHNPVVEYWHSANVKLLLSDKEC